MDFIEDKVLEGFLENAAANYVVDNLQDTQKILNMILKKMP